MKNERAIFYGCPPIKIRFFELMSVSTIVQLVIIRLVIGETWTDYRCQRVWQIVLFFFVCDNGFRKAHDNNNQ